MMPCRGFVAPVKYSCCFLLILKDHKMHINVRKNTGLYRGSGNDLADYNEKKKVHEEAWANRERHVIEPDAKPKASVAKTKPTPN